MYHGGESKRFAACPNCGRQYKVRVTVRRHREFGVKRWFTLAGRQMSRGNPDA